MEAMNGHPGRLLGNFWAKSENYAEVAPEEARAGRPGLRSKSKAGVSCSREPISTI